MELYLSRQAAAMGLAALLGAALGVWYDLLRTARRRLRAATAVCDLCFWLCCTAAVFLFAMQVTGGVLRLYALFGTAAGAALWFLTLSPLFCRLVGGLVDLILRPIAALLRFFAGQQKKIKKALPKQRKKVYDKYVSPDGGK